MYNIIQTRKIWFTISGVLVLVSLILLFTWGLRQGIDFTGGSLLEVRYPEQAPTVTEVDAVLVDLNLHSLSVQPAGDNGMILRFQETDEEIHQQVIEKLSSFLPTEEQEVDPAALGLQLDGGAKITQTVGGQVEELRFEAVGSSIGRELKRNTLWAIIIVMLAIIAYVAWAFRRVSRPVASWKYGLAAVLTLFHDVIIVAGIFVVLGHYFGVEVNTPFVAAILTVFGYSVNDTIVVFDRIRENLPKTDLDFEGTVNKSVNQSITRSINTSLTVILALLAIVFLGGDTIKYFALALVCGIFFGTYSSIFVASPLLVWWEKLKK
jgi:preprotein translocase subunit SecF